MKKIILAVAAVTTLASTAPAQAHGAQWLGPALAGMVVGAALAQPHYPGYGYGYSQPVYIQQPSVYPVQVYQGNYYYPQAQYACRPVYAPDYYGQMTVVGCR
jgi:hypothetical protein